jgi:prepilin-type N-terminal cleavage/methylation domain-containing protein
MTWRVPVVRRRDQDGFTVIELVISMVLIGTIFSIFAVTMSSTIRNSSEVQEDAVLQGEVRATVDAIARDLRQAYTGNGTPALETMTGTQIQFLSPDRQTPFHLRRINYKLSGNSIQRASATSTNTSLPPWTFPALGPYAKQVGSVVNSTVFTYYNSADPPQQTAVAADVASVAIKVVVATPQSPNRQFTYATSVALRVAQ